MENIIKGSCGAAASFSVDREGERTILTVSGSGPMVDSINARSSIFAEYRDTVTDIVIEEGITAIGGYAFVKYAQLARITVPATAAYLGCSCFAEAGELEEVVLPEGVEVLGPKVFDKCPKLRRVSLPSTLRAVDFKAFSNDDALEHVSFNGTEVQWQRQVRVSLSARGNKPLLTAPTREFTALSSNYVAMAQRLGEIVRGGGDGRLYVVAPDLTVPDAKGKSGDAMLVIFPDGQVMAVDSGAPFAGDHAMALVEAMQLERLDYLVTSHPHGDHLGNSERMARYFFETTGGGVREYLHSGMTYKPDEAELREYLTQQGVKMSCNVRAGDELDIGGVHIELFNPVDADMTPPNKGDENVNNASLVMKFTYGASSMLLSGDLYASREHELVQKYGDRLHADVLKANHHGAFTSNTPEWFGAIKPKILFTCCDDFVWTAFLERMQAAGIPNYRVSDCGLVEISMGRDADYRVETEYRGR